MSGHNHEAPQLTKNQTLVRDTLADAKGPLSAYSMLDLLRPAGFRAPLQVYRALDKLVAMGLVHRLESLNAFVACSHPKCDGHATIAFTICDGCGTVSEFADAGLADQLTSMAHARDFSLTKTTIELRGMCSACSVAVVSG